MLLFSTDYKLGSVTVQLLAVMIIYSALLPLHPTFGVTANRDWFHSTPHSSIGSGKCYICLSSHFFNGDFQKVNFNISSVQSLSRVRLFATP